MPALYKKKPEAQGSQALFLALTQLVPGRSGIGPSAFLIPSAHFDPVGCGLLRGGCTVPRILQAPWALSGLSGSPGLRVSLHPLSALQKHQPKLINMAGACDVALTRLEPSEGSACGHLQKPVLLRHLGRGIFDTRTTGSSTASDPKSAGSRLSAPAFLPRS